MCVRFVEAGNVLPERTSISNLFFSTFLPEASGNDVKVYLYAYYLMRNNIVMTDNEFREALGLDQDEIDKAFNYWVHEGIVEKGENDTIVFYDIDSLTLKNIADSEKISRKAGEISPEDNLINLNQNENIREFFNSCDHIVRRQLAPEEKKRLIGWMEEFNMDTEMILHAMSLSYDVKNIKSLDYVKGILRRWHDQGKVTLDDVVDDVLDDFNAQSHIETVRKSLNLKHRDLTDAAIKMIDRWKYDFGFSDDIIALACAQTVNIREPNVNYVNSVMENWYENGVKTAEDAMQMIEKKPKSGYTKPGSFDYDSSRQTDDYDEDELKKLLGWSGEL